MFFFYVVVCALAVALYDGVVQNVGEIKPFSFRVCVSLEQSELLNSPPCRFNPHGTSGQ